MAGCAWRPVMHEAATSRSPIRWSGTGRAISSTSTGWVSNVEYGWEVPEIARYLRRLASFSRLILFDRRGTGLSDPVRTDKLPTLEERMDDARAVLDAADSEQAAIVGASEGGSLGILFAATHPERTTALVGLDIFARRLWSSDYPWAPTAEQRAEEAALIQSDWGGMMDLRSYAPSADDDFLNRMASFFRMSASPGAAEALLRMNTEIDVRHVLPAIRVPTLIVHRSGDCQVSVEEARWIADRIPNAKYVELPGVDHFPFAGDQDALLDEVEEFLTGSRRTTEPDRVLATILFLDIVDSTARAAELGDRRWGELLLEFREFARRELDRFRGEEIETSGDAILASFDGPARAVRCAFAVRDEVAHLGIEVRAGVHTGECVRVDGGLAGIAVHIGARIADLAGPGDVLASSTVRDLVAGSGLEFEDRGVHALRGVPDEWQLLAARPG